MQQAAEALTDLKCSVEVSHPTEGLKKLTARFTVPKARQEDIVDCIGRGFRNHIEDYSDSSIGFTTQPRRTRRSSQQPPPLAL